MIFNNRQHFINYCRKIVRNKLGVKADYGQKKFKQLLIRTWNSGDYERVQSFVNRLSQATPEQIEASLKRLRGTPKQRGQAKPTGLYGIWSSGSKSFIFGIQEPTPAAARRKLRDKIGNNAKHHRFNARQIKDSKYHAKDFLGGLKYKKEEADNE